MTKDRQISDQVIARFWAKVNKDGPVPLHCPGLGTCWLWTASLRNKGYGAFTYKIGETEIQDRAHRFSFRLHIGEITDSLFVLHHCDTPACVNPAHLFLGTNLENVQDMMAKGRHVSGGTYGPGNYERGVDHHGSILNPDIIRAIREDRKGGLSISALARKYGLALGHAHRIVTRKAWAHVE